MVAKTKDMAKNAWWFVVLTGILGILFGLFAVFWPGMTTAVLVYAFSIFITVLGVVWAALSIASVKAYKLWWLSLVMSLLFVAAGIYLLANPMTTFVIFIVLVAILIFIQALGDFINASYAEGKNDKLLWVVTGTLGIIFGLVLMLHPQSATLAFVWVWGLYALIRGFAAIIYAIRVRMR